MRPTAAGPLKRSLIESLPGEYAFEPKVNGWRGLIHVPTLTVFNRHGKAFSTYNLYEDSLQWLWENMPKKFEWLDCEMLARRHAMDQGSIVVLDWVTEELTYEQRREELYMEVPMTMTSKYNKVFMLPQYGMKDLEYAWESLQHLNAKLGCEYYEGLVGKRLGSLYEHQLISSSLSTALWLKWRFDQYTQLKEL